MAFIKYGEDRDSEIKLKMHCPACGSDLVYKIDGVTICRNCGKVIDNADTQS